MSIRAMNWAWAVHLPPASKLVLMALADVADDHGACYPSHKWLAHKCCMSERSVRRVVELLQAQRLLRVDARFGTDGRRSSNRYCLALERDPPDKMSGGVVTGDQGPRTAVTTPLVSGVLVTTTYPSVEPSIKTTTGDQGGVVQGAASAPEAGVHGGGQQLVFPNAVAEQRRALEQLLQGMAPELAQQVLDELAGRMAVGEVRNPLRYCAALLRRARAGQFIPDLGRKVIAARERSFTVVQTEHADAETALRPFNTLPLPPKFQKLFDRIRESASHERSDLSDGEHPNRGADDPAWDH